MKDNKMIGIVGGMGPYATVDLVQKILDQTNANDDQSYLPMAILSAPHAIGDRTEFLLGQSNINPAFAISKIIKKLTSIGANIVGIPCNTAHAPQIFNVVLEELKSENSEFRLIHMIHKVAEFIQKHYSAFKNIGVLCTTGSYKTGVYSNVFKETGFNPIMPNGEKQDLLHKAIYDREYGIKSQSNPVTEIAKSQIIKVIRHLNGRGADVIILGCTELGMAIPDQKIENTTIIDPTLVLARALIREVDSSKLKPWIDI